MAGAAAAATAVAPLGLLNARRAEAAAACAPASFSAEGFGPLAEKLPLNTDQLGSVAGVSPQDIRLNNYYPT